MLRQKVDEFTASRPVSRSASSSARMRGSAWRSRACTSRRVLRVVPGSGVSVSTGARSNPVTLKANARYVSSTAGSSCSSSDSQATTVVPGPTSLRQQFAISVVFTNPASATTKVSQWSRRHATSHQLRAVGMAAPCLGIVTHWRRSAEAMRAVHISERQARPSLPAWSAPLGIAHRLSSVIIRSPPLARPKQMRRRTAGEPASPTALGLLSTRRSGGRRGSMAR